MLKIFLLVLCACSINIKENIKSLKIESLYEKSYVKLENYLEYMNSISKEKLENLNIEWLNIFLKKDILNKEDLDKIKSLTSYELSCIGPIFASISLDKTEIFKQLLSIKDEMLLIDDQGNNPLHIASYFGRKDIVEIILEDKILIRRWLNVENSKTFTPFHLAAFQGNIDILKLFIDILKKGEKEEKKDILKNSSIPLAVAKGRLEILELLNEESKDKNVLMFYGMLNKNLDFFKALEAKLNIEDLSLKVGRSKSNLLMLSAQIGSKDIFEYLLSKNIGLEELDAKGRNLLFYAIKGKEPKMLDYIFEVFNSKKINIENFISKNYHFNNSKMQSNLLGYALKKKDKNIINDLFERFKERDDILENAIYSYINYRKVDQKILSYFIKNIETKNSIYQKALYILIAKGCNESLRELFNKENVNMSFNGVKPIYYAVIKGNIEAVRLFIELDAEIDISYNFESEKNYSLLEIAEEQSKEILNILLRNKDIKLPVVDKNLKYFDEYFNSRPDKMNILLQNSDKGKENSWLTLAVKRANKNVILNIINELSKYQKIETVDEIINYKSKLGSALSIACTFPGKFRNLSRNIDVINRLIEFNFSIENLEESLNNLNNINKLRKIDQNILEDTIEKLKFKIIELKIRHQIPSDGRYLFENLIKNQDTKAELEKINLSSQIKNAIMESDLSTLKFLFKKFANNFKAEGEFENLVNIYIRHVNESNVYKEEILLLILSNFPELIRQASKQMPLHLALDLLEEKNNEIFTNIIKLLINKNSDLLTKDRYNVSALEKILKSKNSTILDIIKGKLSSIEKFNLVNKYIDKYINEIQEGNNDIKPIKIKIEAIDYFYLIGSFINASEKYLNEKEEPIKLIITTLALKNLKYNILSTNNKLAFEDRNEDLFCGYKLVYLKYWKNIIQDDILYDNYDCFTSLEKSKQYLLDKIKRIDEEAEGIAKPDRMIFRNRETAQYAKTQLQKLFQIINSSSEDESYIDKLSYVVNTLLEGSSGCHAHFIESINTCMSFCLETSYEKSLESWMQRKMLKAKEEILGRIISNYFKNYELDDNLKIFIEKELGILPKFVANANFTDMEIRRILGEKLEKIKEDFINMFNENLIEYIMNEKKDRGINEVMEYLDLNIGSNFMGDIGYITYSEEGNVKKETLVALLYLNGYLNLEISS